jgi:hypothetical protein
MKSIAVMQPYLFPYLGYFQLMQAVDEFVFFDDANYIKRGWVNRNRIYCLCLPAPMSEVVTQIRPIATGYFCKETNIVSASH